MPAWIRYLRDRFTAFSRFLLDKVGVHDPGSFWTNVVAGLLVAAILLVIGFAVKNARGGRSDSPIVQPATPAVLLGGVIRVDDQVTGPGQTVTYTYNLAPKEILVGDGNDIDGKGYHGCIRFLIHGPGKKVVEATGGAIQYFKNVTNEAEAQALLATRTQSLMGNIQCAALSQLPPPEIDPMLPG